MDIDSIVARVTEDVYRQLTGTATDESAGDLAGCIEHSLLNPDTPAETIRKGCEDAKKYEFANICVSPYYVSMAADILRGSGVGVCAPVGFPYGAASTRAKCAEIREAIMNGATELDVSMMIVAAKSGDFDGVRKDLFEMVSTAGNRVKIKAIYEQGLLNEGEREKVLQIAVRCGADYIKISNALTGKKAAAEDVRYVRSIVGPGMGIKIDGGISDAKTVRELMAAGAQRFGCSRSVQIIEGQGE
jgi:deoxyribose-phosphate aldolase